jgi:hypothetical protein
LIKKVASSKVLKWTTSGVTIQVQQHFHFLFSFFISFIDLKEKKMWSRDGLKSGSTMIYRSTPHLFVYQPCEDDDDSVMTSSTGTVAPPTADALRIMMQDELTDGGEDTEPSDSGYAASSSGSASATTPEAIYYSTMELSTSRKEKDAIRRLSFIKYAAADGRSSAGGGADVYSTSGSSSDQSSVCDVDGLVHPVIHQKQQLQQQQMLTELELLRVETFFRGNQTQIFVGKSLANL